MPKTHPPYDPEFRQRILELLHSGRTLKSLAEVRAALQRCGIEPPRY